jgi:hypothetical protein
VHPFTGTLVRGDRLADLLGEGGPGGRSGPGRRGSPPPGAGADSLLTRTVATLAAHTLLLTLLAETI